MDEAMVIRARGFDGFDGAIVATMISVIIASLCVL